MTVLFTSFYLMNFRLPFFILTLEKSFDLILDIFKKNIIEG